MGKSKPHYNVGITIINHPFGNGLIIHLAQLSMVMTGGWFIVMPCYTHNYKLSHRSWCSTQRWAHPHRPHLRRPSRHGARHAACPPRAEAALRLLVSFQEVLEGRGCPSRLVFEQVPWFSLCGTSRYVLMCISNFVKVCRYTYMVSLGHVDISMSVCIYIYTDLFMCKSIYIICIHTYILLYTYICTCFVHICSSAHMHVCMDACMYGCMHVCMYAYYC